MNRSPSGGIKRIAFQKKKKKKKGADYAFCQRQKPGHSHTFLL